MQVFCYHACVYMCNRVVFGPASYEQPVYTLEIISLKVYNYTACSLFLNTSRMVCYILFKLCRLFLLMLILFIMYYDQTHRYESTEQFIESTQNSVMYRKQ